MTSWTGIAAALFPGGTTCHQAFGLPFPFERGNSVSSLTGDSIKAKKIREAKIIVIDEASNLTGLFLEELDRLLVDITGNGQRFGGKIVIITGDFRQTLPVTKRGEFKICNKNLLR